GRAGGQALHAPRALAPLPDARLLEEQIQALRREDLRELPDPLRTAAAALALRRLPAGLAGERGPDARPQPLHDGAAPRRTDLAPDALAPPLRAGGRRAPERPRAPGLPLCRPARSLQGARRARRGGQGSRSRRADRRRGPALRGAFAPGRGAAECL